MSEDGFLTIGELAARWRVGTESARSIVKAGAVPMIPLGRLQRVRLVDVLKYEERKANQFRKREVKP